MTYCVCLVFGAWWVDTFTPDGDWVASYGPYATQELAQAKADETGFAAGGE